MKNELGYGESIAFCDACNKPLKRAPARWDGELTFVGYLPCPIHPHGKVRYEELGIIRNTMPQLFEHICKRLSDD